MEHLDLPVKELIKAAMEAKKKAYTPYSGYQVGAALLTNELRIYTGCNIENASYTPTICAERTAIFKAVSEGRKRFLAIAIVGGAKGKPMEEYAYPCGVCRQVMMEFCDPETFEIILAAADGKYKIYRLKELLPEGFGPDNLVIFGGFRSK